MNSFWPWQKQNSDFQCFAFPYEVTLGSKDPLPFLRAYLFKRGQVEHALTMTNLKLKPSLFTPALVHSLQELMYADYSVN